MVQGRAACILGLVLVLLAAPIGPLGAEENESQLPTRDEVIDNAGVAYGVTFGNLIYPGFKAATMILAAPQAGLAWLLSLGDTEQARTVWRAQTEGPYFIDREEAQKALGLDAESEPYPVEDRELSE